MNLQLRRTEAEQLSWKNQQPARWRRPARMLIVAALMLQPCFFALSQTPIDAALQTVLDRVGEYVARYGQQASAIVAVEKYTQSVVIEGRSPIKPRQLTAEFAIVKVPGGWVGYRDVFEVNGKKLHDRAERLASLVKGSGDIAQFTKIANESARFNIGPISRNFNVPTAALFFFQPLNLKRFSFTRKGEKQIEGNNVWEIDFKETTTPTLVTTGSGKSAPVEGTLWVVPENGTIVRTTIKLRKFLDMVSIVASPQRAALDEIDSEADVDATYRLEKELGLWLPAKMSEFYYGPLALETGKPPVIARANTLASYSDFKQFTTAVKIK
jgi:hypothetical protein